MAKDVVSKSITTYLEEFCDETDAISFIMNIISQETNFINSDQTTFLKLCSAVQDHVPHIQWKSDKREHIKVNV